MDVVFCFYVMKRPVLEVIPLQLDVVLDVYFFTEFLSVTGEDLEVFSELLFSDAVLDLQDEFL